MFVKSETTKQWPYEPACSIPFPLMGMFLCSRVPSFLQECLYRVLSSLYIFRGPG